MDIKYLFKNIGVQSVSRIPGLEVLGGGGEVIVYPGVVFVLGHLMTVRFITSLWQLVDVSVLHVIMHVT